jgi:hypothetical protein
MKKFSIHKALVVERSKFFANALNGSWKESDDGIVLLPEDDPEIFELYLQVLYTGTVPIKEHVSAYSDNEEKTKKDPEILEKEVEQAVSREMEKVCKLYVLNEKLQDIESQNLLVSTMVALTSEKRASNLYHYPGQDIVTSIYKGTMPGNPMRKLLVDLYVFHGVEQWLKGHDSDRFHNDFLYDLSIRMMQAMKDKSIKDPSGDATNYHE